jgi:ribosome-associated protein
VNKLNSRATLTVSLDDLAAVLPAHAMRRLPALAGPYLAEGRLVIHAQAARSQRDNRQAALDHLVDLLKRSLVRPKRRKPTRPPASSRRKRIETKKQRAQVKQMRRPPQD